MLQYAFENVEKPKIVSTEYVQYLGQSEMSIEALRVVMVEMGLLNSKVLTLTEFGKTVAKNDLFFDNKSTLWICHFNISSNHDNYVWNRFTYKVLLDVENYTKEDFYKYYDDVVELNKGKSAIKSMHKEVKSILNAYSVQQFKYLRLLYKDHEDKYQQDNTVELDPLVFLYCILQYMEKKKINASALTIEEVTNSEDTPSKIFHLSNYQVNEILNKLYSRQLIGIEKFGDLNQVRFPVNLTKESILKEIYEEAER